jgi:hypothetical protein
LRLDKGAVPDAGQVVGHCGPGACAACRWVEDSRGPSRKSRYAMDFASAQPVGLSSLSNNSTLKISYEVIIDGNVEFHKIK